MIMSISIFHLRRDGVPSVTGRISKHWPEDAFLTNRYYSTNAIAFVESNTTLARQSAMVAAELYVTVMMEGKGIVYRTCRFLFRGG